MFEETVLCLAVRGALLDNDERSGRKGAGAVLTGGLGGPIDTRGPLLGRDFKPDIELRAAFEGVLVRGVDITELSAEESGLVGDFVGDYRCQHAALR